MKADTKSLWLWEQVIKPLLNADWFSRLSHFNQLIVGFSGGLDSTVLLHVLASHPFLLPKLIAVHVNHGISMHSLHWQRDCERFCQHLGINLITQTVHFDRSANLEERARIARYEVFSSLMTEQDCLVLGHHLDDQAETLLLQLFRGAGIDGLAAMTEFGHLELGKIARPFLHHSRKQLEHYAVLQQLTWSEDESNQDINYSRNYLRHQIMPLLRKKWPGVEGNIARTATHCQQAKKNLDALATYDVSCPKIKSLEENRTCTTFRGLPAVNGQQTSIKNSLFIGLLKGLEFERVSNILRVWLRNNHVQLPATATFHRLIDEVILANASAIPEVSWGEIIIRRYQEHLYLDRKNIDNFPGGMVQWSEFPSPLILQDTGISLLAKKAKQGLVIPKGAQISVRFRQGGEKFYWHGQTKNLKKLLQEWGVPPWLRERIPLVYFNEQLAAVIGYAVSDLFFTKGSLDTWLFFSRENAVKK